MTEAVIIDAIRLPGYRYYSILQCPCFGSTSTQFDD